MAQILLVSDDAVTRERLQHILLSAGWPTVVATTAKLAIQLFARAQPRLAVVDIEMQDGVGAETISLLRWQRRDAAVLAITRAPVPPDLLKTARAYGARQVLIGPVAAEELVAAVRAAQ